MAKLPTNNGIAPYATSQLDKILQKVRDGLIDASTGKVVVSDTAELTRRLKAVYCSFHGIRVIDLENDTGYDNAATQFATLSQCLAGILFALQENQEHMNCNHLCACVLFLLSKNLAPISTAESMVGKMFLSHFGGLAPAAATKKGGRRKENHVYGLSIGKVEKPKKNLSRDEISDDLTEYVLNDHFQNHGVGNKIFLRLVQNNGYEHLAPFLSMITLVFGGKKGDDHDKFMLDLVCTMKTAPFDALSIVTQLSRAIQKKWGLDNFSIFEVPWKERYHYLSRYASLMAVGTDALVDDTEAHKAVRRDRSHLLLIHLYFTSAGEAKINAAHNANSSLEKSGLDRLVFYHPPTRCFFPTADSQDTSGTFQVVGDPLPNQVANVIKKSTHHKTKSNGVTNVHQQLTAMLYPLPLSKSPRDFEIRKMLVLSKRSGRRKEDDDSLADDAAGTNINSDSSSELASKGSDESSGKNGTLPADSTAIPAPATIQSPDTKLAPKDAYVGEWILHILVKNGKRKEVLVKSVAKSPVTNKSIYELRYPIPSGGGIEREIHRVSAEDVAEGRRLYLLEHHGQERKKRKVNRGHTTRKSLKN